MPEFDFTSAAALRASLGEPRPRTLPDMVELALAAADADAELLTGNLEYVEWSARDLVNQVIGFDLNDRIREVLQIVIRPMIEKEVADGPQDAS